LTQKQIHFNQLAKASPFPQQKFTTLVPIESPYEISS